MKSFLNCFKKTQKPRTVNEIMELTTMKVLMQNSFFVLFSLLTFVLMQSNKQMLFNSALKIEQFGVIFLTRHLMGG